MREQFSEADGHAAVAFVEEYLSRSKAYREIWYDKEFRESFAIDSLLRDFFIDFGRKFPEVESVQQDGRRLIRHFNFWKEKKKHSVDAFRTPNYLTKIQAINGVQLNDVLTFPPVELDDLYVLESSIDEAHREEHNRNIEKWTRYFRASNEALKISGLENA